MTYDPNYDEEDDDDEVPRMKWKRTKSVLQIAK